MGGPCYFDARRLGRAFERPNSGVADPKRVKTEPAHAAIEGNYVGGSAGSNFLPGQTIADPGWAI